MDGTELTKIIFKQLLLFDFLRKQTKASTHTVVTKVEVASLISGLEEASPGLGVNISPLLHQQLHVLLRASLYGNV